MKLWTIQHRAAYEEMLRTGVLRANHRIIKTKEVRIYDAGREFADIKKTERFFSGGTC